MRFLWFMRILHTITVNILYQKLFYLSFSEVGQDGVHNLSDLRLSSHSSHHRILLLQKDLQDFPYPSEASSLQKGLWKGQSVPVSVQENQEMSESFSILHESWGPLQSLQHSIRGFKSDRIQE